MKDDILTYREMCDTEHVQTLQRGMNYRLGISHSVILMSQRSNAPYNDQILEDGLTIIYEGHDVPKSAPGVFPKLVDQPEKTKTGKLTQNGKFADAASKHKSGAPAEKIRVYEKLFSGVWSYRGLFDLVDFSYTRVGERRVFKFVLRLTDDDSQPQTQTVLRERSRIIPTSIKKGVWERDKGKCVICGSEDELHFDHDIPYSKGGTSITIDNVRILCARHNLTKSDKIE